MVNWYVFKIINGDKKWDAVPNLWKKKVQDELVAQGYTLNDDGTVTKQ